MSLAISIISSFGQKKLSPALSSPCPKAWYLPQLRHPLRHYEALAGFTLLSMSFRRAIDGGRPATSFGSLFARFLEENTREVPPQLVWRDGKIVFDIISSRARFQPKNFELSSGMIGKSSLGPAILNTADDA
jgi:hypothetical protein